MRAASGREGVGMLTCPEMERRFGTAIANLYAGHIIPE